MPPRTPYTPIACTNCGIYQLCYSVGGDTDLSVLDTLVKTRKTMKRGDLLYRAGDQFRAIYAIRGGSVKSSIVTGDGRVQVTGFHVAGKVLGLDSILTNHYNCDVTAMETTGVCEVPYSRFEELGREIPDLQNKMLKIMSQEILDIRELMILLGKMKGEERLATYLLSMANGLGKRGSPSAKFKMSMSRSDIANYLGLAEETISRIFTRFQEEGLISLQRRNITINDFDRLSTLSRRS